MNLTKQNQISFGFGFQDGPKFNKRLKTINVIKGELSNPVFGRETIN